MLTLKPEEAGPALDFAPFTEALPDGTPIVDRGIRWGLMSRQAQRNENDRGLTGYVVAAADFDGDGHPEVILAPRYYSHRPVVAMSLVDGVPTSREGCAPVTITGNADGVDFRDKGAVAAIDWDGDGRVDLVRVHLEMGEDYSVDPATGVCPEDQRCRYQRDGRWTGALPTPVLRLYRNTGANAGRIQTQKNLVFAAQKNLGAAK